MAWRKAGAKIRDLESKTSKWRTPIIALSTLTRTELSSACDGMEFDGYVPIPFSSTELFAVIGQYIDLNSDRVQKRILTEFSEALGDTDDFLPPLHCGGAKTDRCAEKCPDRALVLAHGL